MDLNFRKEKEINILELKIFEKIYKFRVYYKFFKRSFEDCFILFSDNLLILKNLKKKLRGNLEAMCNDRFNWLLNNLEILSRINI